MLSKSKPSALGRKKFTLHKEKPHASGRLITEPVPPMSRTEVIHTSGAGCGVAHGKTR